MVYRVLADIVLVLHLCFIVFVILGGLLVLYRRGVAWAHLPAAAWGAAIEFFSWTCPLTPIEQSLRRRGGEAGYEGGFIEHYILPLIYIDDLTRPVQIVLGSAVVIINGLIYYVAWRRWRTPADRTA